MNKKIKIIELLNKIANGEEVPKTIKYENEILTLDKDNDYINKDTYCRLLDLIYFNFSNLHDEVEIIEEENEIDIQSIKENNSVNHREDINQENINILVKAVKQLDRAVKQLDKNKEDKR